MVLGVAAPAPLRRDEEAALVAPRPGGRAGVRGQACGPPVDHRARAFGALRRLVDRVEARLHGRGRRRRPKPGRERRDDERRDGPRGDRRRIGTGDPGPQRHEKSAARRRRRRAIPKPRRRVVALPRKDLREAEALLDELVPKLKRVLGDSHPYTQMGITNLQTARVRVKVATENPNQKIVMVRRY